MDYAKIRENERQFKSLTSLSVEEFDVLLEEFSAQWERFVAQKTLKDHPRQRRYSTKAPDQSASTADKLFFILIYNKQNPLQEYQAASWGLEQSMCNKWPHLLQPILTKSIAPQFHPARQVAHQEMMPQNEEVKMLDAAERPIQRSSYNQQEEYSGKKHTHTVKKLIIITLTGFVLFLGPTEPGPKHDKTLAQDLHFSQESIILADLGFYGLSLPNIKLLLNKKPQNKELAQSRKDQNTQFARAKVKVEHAIGGIQIMRICKARIRNSKIGFRDSVMLTTTALYNLCNQKTFCS